VVTQPLGFILFFTAAIAETKRAPFDLPEGEPELIGYFVEYSGMRFGMFYLAEFIEVVFAAALLTTVYFGGWQIPFVDSSTLPSHGLTVLLQVGFWTFKVLFFCWLQLLIRWTLPRFRPDQLMELGWKKLLPASLINIVLTAAAILWLQ
jgi:NADH-quinone oxidoreductase subunit H